MKKRNEGTWNYESVELTTKINKGNWNYKNKKLPKILTKPIGITKINGFELSWKHDEIFKLIELFYRVDIESMKMIKDTNINTGEAKFIEKPFINKLKEKIKELEEQNENLPM